MSYRSTSTVALLATLALSAGWLPAEEQIPAGVRVEIECNRQQYYPGEPLLVRTQLINQSNTGWPQGRGAFGLGRTFSLWFRRDKGNWERDTRVQVLEVRDKALIRAPLSPLEKVERVDFLFLEEVGSYDVKVVLDARKFGKFESNEVAIEVVHPPATEPLLRIPGVDEQSLKDLGRFVVVAHYCPSSGQQFPIFREGGFLTKDVVGLIAKAEEVAADSRYLPYLQYAYLKTWILSPLGDRDPKDLIRRRAETAWRCKDETFWLKPEAGLALFQFCRLNGPTERAREVGNYLLELHPHWSRIRNEPLYQEIENLPPPPPPMRRR